MNLSIWNISFYLNTSSLLNTGCCVNFFILPLFVQPRLILAEVVEGENCARANELLHPNNVTRGLPVVSITECSVLVLLVKKIRWETSNFSRRVIKSY